MIQNLQDLQEMLEAHPAVKPLLSAAFRQQAAKLRSENAEENVAVDIAAQIFDAMAADIESLKA